MTEREGHGRGFDPDAYALAEILGFEGLKIGDRFPSPPRTITEAHFSAFQAISGDNHPIHYDREYCQAQGHKDLLAHGLQVLAVTAAGAGLFPHVVGPALIGFIEQSSKFLKGVFPGDTLYPLLEISALERQRTTGVVTIRATLRNQDGELVLEGEQKYLLRLAG